MQFITLKSFKSFTEDQSGATAIEYVMIAAAMCLALVASTPILATSVKGKFISIGGFFNSI